MAEFFVRKLACKVSSAYRTYYNHFCVSPAYESYAIRLHVADDSLRTT